MHIRIHNNDKRYPCEVEGCDKVFIESSKRTIHMRVHSGERPYQCKHENCDASFSQHSGLMAHYISHSGMKAYKCHIPDCNRIFTQSSSRNHHEKFFHDKQHRETYIKKKEEWIVALLKKNDIAFDRELTISFKNYGEADTWTRLDFVIYKEDHIIILSVDEFQHLDYEIICDVARMSKIVCAIRASGDERRILWLRFNPDFFSYDGEKMRVEKKNREDRILQSIINSEQMITDQNNVSIYYLYYDCYLDEDDDKLKPVIALSPEYDPQWSALICGTIID